MIRKWKWSLLTLYWGYIEIMEEKMETTITYWGCTIYIYSSVPNDLHHHLASRFKNWAPTAKLERKRLVGWWMPEVRWSAGASATALFCGIVRFSRSRYLRGLYQDCVRARM